MATQKVLLLEDIGAKGRKGEIVAVKAGFARNFLYPKARAIRATKHAVRLQERLQSERNEQAMKDRGDAEKVAASLEGNIYEFTVKADAKGHLYGSVSAIDILNMINETEEMQLDRRQVTLVSPIKKVGTIDVIVRFNEGVTCTVKAKVNADGVVPEEEAASESDDDSTEEEFASEEEAQE
jgi:large subunit ribosomal protein L9